MSDIADHSLTPDPIGDRPRSLAVYVHWPFCQAKCPYCDFNSHVRTHGIDEPRYVAAYERELAYFSSRVPNTNIGSVFFGGGTPSLMSPGTVSRIIELIAGHWRMSDDVEITLEANPTSVEADRFNGYREAGVNRVSLGVQALNDEDLKRLGRLHSKHEALAALDIARANFDRVSFDLIYARPRQSESDWEAELSVALTLAAGHLSLYQLTVEPGTPFAALHAAGKLNPPEADTAARLFEITQNLTSAAGYEAYEISNHALPGQASLHNLNYWRGGDYVGVGPGAHGRIRLENVRHATDTLKSPESWLLAVEDTGHGLASCSPLAPIETAEEYLLMALRLSEGMNMSRFVALGGAEIDSSRIGTLESEDLVRREGQRLIATDKGRLVLNAVIAMLAVS